MNELFDNLEAVLKRVSETADFSGSPAESVMSRGFFGTTPLHVALYGVMWKLAVSFWRLVPIRV